MVCTRSQSAQLVQFDPEPERTLHKQRREHFLVSDFSLKDTFLQRLFLGVSDRKEPMAFAMPEAGEPLRVTLAARANELPSCVVYPEEEGDTFEIRHHMLEILPSYHGLAHDDPNMHITEFLMGCKNILVRGFSVESIKLRLFPYTLKDKAKTWLFTLPSGSITSWAQLSQKFLSKFYPAAKTLDIRTKILSFAQKPNEEFHEAWERFSDLFRKCPHANINGDTRMQIF